MIEECTEDSVPIDAHSAKESNGPSRMPRVIRSQESVYARWDTRDQTARRERVHPNCGARDAVNSAVV